jgi:hypothetical protein
MMVGCMRCPKHPHVQLICPACVGSTTSSDRARASRENGKLGGRPKKNPTKKRGNSRKRET